MFVNPTSNKHVFASVILYSLLLRVKTVQPGLTNLAEFDSDTHPCRLFGYQQQGAMGDNQPEAASQAVSRRKDHHSRQTLARWACHAEDPVSIQFRQEWSGHCLCFEPEHEEAVRQHLMEYMESWPPGGDIWSVSADDSHRFFKIIVIYQPAAKAWAEAQHQQQV